MSAWHTKITLIFISTITLAYSDNLILKLLNLHTPSSIFNARSVLPLSTLSFESYPHASDASTLNRYSYDQPYVKVVDKKKTSDIRHQRPDTSLNFINHFVSSYQHKKPHLIAADPCQFLPCGPNTHCKRNTRSYNSRICVCNKGYVPNPSLSDSCVQPCFLKKCGPNSICVTDGEYPRCVCLSKSFPIYDQHSHTQRCIDPCHHHPCFGKNTLCKGLSAYKRVCVCLDDTVPTDDIEKNGCVTGLCSKPGYCNPLTEFCTEAGGVAKCTCLPGFYFDKATLNCNKRPCSVANACGSNAFCSEDVEFNKVCNCIQGYFRHHELGCVDPCEEMACNGPDTVCLGLSPKRRTCVCKTGKVAIRLGSTVIGCEDACDNDNCGAFSSCKNNQCTCDQGYFPESGKQRDNTSPNCINPCDNCYDSPHTICVARSASDYDCICAPGYMPTGGGDAETNGCISDCTQSNCDANRFCNDATGTVECICILGLFNDGACTGCYFMGLYLAQENDITLPDGSVANCLDGGDISFDTAPPATNYATSCVHPFMLAQGGCYYARTDTVSSADAARQACIDLKGDLAGPPDINDGESYHNVLGDIGATRQRGLDYWVGIRQTAAGEPFYQTYKNPNFILFPLDSPLWERVQSQQPNGPLTGIFQNCARLFYYNSVNEYRVHDKPCNNDDDHPYLCEIPNVP